MMKDNIKVTTVGHLLKCTACKLACAFILFTMLLLLAPGHVQAADSSGDRNWNISGSGVWDYTTSNWHDGLFATPFAAWDYAIFSLTGSHTITLSGGGTEGIETGGMKITDGSYTFNSSTDRKLIGRIQPTNGDDSYQADGKLQLATSGTITINIETDFETGTIITAGTLVIGHDKALGVYSYNSSLSTEAQRGQITVQGNNTNVRVLASRNLQNRFVFSGGSSFYIAPGALLTINDVKNTAAGANGGAIYAGTGVSFTGGGSLEIIDSTATNSGGAIYAQSLDLSALNALYFSGNEAVQGGALYVTGNLSIKGNAYFIANKATTGGAIYMQGHATGALNANFDTSAGHIAFVNNTGGSIHLNQNITLALSGNNNIYFNNPLSSGTGSKNSLTKTGNGLVQFLGINELNQAGNVSNGVNVTGGTFRVVEGASFSDNGTGATFNLATGATLAGGGSITSGTFTLQGFISPDKDTFSIPTNIGVTAASDPAQTAPDSDYVIGTLKITGNVTFTNATMLVDIRGGAADKLEITGTATVSSADKNTVDVSSFVIGKYMIMSASDGGFALDAFKTITVNGMVYSPRQGYASLTVENGTKEVWLNMVARIGIYKVVWGGGNTDNGSAKTSNWNYTASNTNWKELQTGIYDYFQAGDYAIFDNTATSKAVNVSQSGGVVVGGMNIQAGTYTFSGEAITSSNAQGGDEILLVQNGATATFSNNVTMAGGLDIMNGGKVILNHTATNGAAFNMNIINAGTLTYTIGAGAAYEQTGAITGSTGVVVKDGAGVLTLTGNHAGASLTQSLGGLNLDGKWTGAFTQAAGAGDFGATNGSSIVGNATFASGVNLQGASTGNRLTIDGNMTYNAANLKVGLGSANSADNIYVNSVANFDGGDGGSVTGNEWRVGKFVLISASSFNYVSGTTEDSLKKYTITFNSGALTKRQYAYLDVETGTRTSLVLNTVLTNSKLYWVGAANNWNTAESPLRWNDTSATGTANDYFMNRDYVIFTSSSAGNVNVAENVTVSGMEITGGTRTFTGSGSITGTSTGVIDPNNLITVTDELQVSGGSNTFGVPVTFNKMTVTGGSTYFTNNAAFAGGLTVGGGNVYIATGGNLDGTAITVNTGSLYYNSSDDYVQTGNLAGVGAVYKNGAGKLTLTGSISASGQFAHSYGEVVLATNWLGQYYQANATTTLSISGARGISGATSLLGTVDFGSATTNTLDIGAATLTLSGSTININLAATNQANKITVASGGTITYGATNINTFNVNGWTPGTYTLLTYNGSQNITDAIALDKFKVTSGGAALAARSGKALLSINGRDLVLTVAIGSGSDNLRVVWGGDTAAPYSTNWNYATTPENWVHEATETRQYFAQNDYAVFKNGVGYPTVNVNGTGGVVISGMEITGGTFTFNGEKIFGTGTATGIYAADGLNTQKLLMTGGTGTFNNAVEFTNGLDVSNATATFNRAFTFGGMTIGAGGTVNIVNTATSGATSNAAAISHSGTGLNYNLGAAFTQSGAISGSGNVTKSGAGPLTLSAVNTSTGRFTQQSTGTVSLASRWSGDYQHTSGLLITGTNARIGGNYTQDAGGTLVSGNNTTIGGAAELAGAIHINASAIGTLTTNTLHLNGATLNIAVSNNNVSDKIVVANGVTFGANKNNIVLVYWAEGTYTLIESASMDSNAKDYFNAITISSGGGSGAHDSYNLYVQNNNLMLSITSGGNLDLVWNGTNAAPTWNTNTGNTNWLDNSTAAYFATNDSVKFTKDAARQAVTLGENVTVSKMTIDGGTYSFEGNYTISGTGSAQGENLLVVTGNGTWANFMNAGVNFTDLQILDGAGVAIMNNAVIDAQIENHGFLTYALANAYTQDGNLVTAGGRLIKEGNHLLTLKGNIISDNASFFEHVGGAVDLQTDWKGMYFQRTSDATLITTGDRTIEGKVELAGKLQVGGDSVAKLNTGALVFNGVNLSLTIVSATSYDTIVSSGVLSLSSVNTIDISQFLAGTYTIVAGAGAVENYNNNSFTDVTINGAALSGHEWAKISVSGSGNDLLLNLSERNISIVWAGPNVPNGNLWDITNTNWAGGIKFIQNDFVIFNDSAHYKNVNVAIPVTVAGMDVSGGAYTFSGGSITGVDSAIDFTATNTLTISGAATTARFQNAISFGNINITTGAAAIIEVSAAGSGSFGSSAINVNGSGSSLTYDIADTYNYTQSTAISNSGAIIKTGAGTLIIANQYNTGDGTFTQAQNAGTVQLNYNWGGAYIQETGGTLVSGANTTIGQASSFKGTIDVAGSAVGTLTVNGNVTFENTNYNVTLADGGQSDMLAITGVATVTSFNSININAWENGTYIIMTATSGLSAADFAGTQVLLNGQAISGRINAQLAAYDTYVALTTSATNLDLYWTGESADRTWNDTSNNWKSARTGGSDEIFIPDDYATFTTGGAGLVAVSIAKVQTSGMLVEGGQYTFAGGDIAGEAGNVGGAATDGKLRVAGTADVTFQNNVDFANGMEIANTAQVTLENNSSANGAFADNMTIVNAGTLTFDIDSGVVTQKGAISGTGTVVKTGTAALVLEGSHGDVGANFAHNQGELTLTGEWTGAYNQAASAALYSASGKITGDAALLGTTVIDSASGMLTVVGTLNMNNATLRLTVAANGASGKIVASNLNATNSNVVNINEFIQGAYLIIVGAGYSGANENAFGGVTIGSNNTALTDRQMAQFEVVVNGLQMTLTSLGDSINLTWAGTLPGNNNWNNNGDKNWDRGDGTLISFNDRDYATFTDNNNVAKLVNVNGANGVTSSGMIITGGDYTFTGNKISGFVESGDYAGATGALDVIGNATAIFENTVGFANGLNIKDTAAVTLHNNGNTAQGAFDNNMTVAVGQNADLIFDLEGASASYTQQGRITGNGNVTKTGVGSLVVDNQTNSNTGDFLHRQGSVNLVYDWAGAYKLEAGATLISGANTTVGSGSEFSGIINPNGKNALGTLNIDGDATFNNATYILTLVDPDQSDKVFVNGNAAFVNSGLANIDIVDFANGTYTIMTTGSGMENFDATKPVITIAGAAIAPTDRFDVRLEVKGQNLMLTAETASLELYWNLGSGEWNYANTNWAATKTGAQDQKFLVTDYAIFTQPGSGTVNVGETRVQVSGMVIESDSVYTFTGGEIFGKKDAGGNQVTATGQLTLEANASATFRNAVNFSDGMIIANTGKVTLENDGTAAGAGSFADAMTIANAGALEFNINNATVSYTQTGLISGAGTVEKTGTGTLVLNARQGDGLFTQTLGNVELEYGWGGAYAQNAGQLTTAANAVINGNYTQASGSVLIAGSASQIAGNASLSGTTSIDGTLKIGGNLSLAGGTLNMTIAENNVSDVITVAGSISIIGGNVTTINLNQWISGVYIVATAQTNGIAAVIADFDVTIAGSTIGKRNVVEVSVVGANNNQLQLSMADGNSIELIWQGGNASSDPDVNVWSNDPDRNNWTDGVEETYFVDKDKVIFDDTGKAKDVVVDDKGVTVSDMVVDGSDYTFDGGPIAGKPDTDGSLTGSGSLHVTDNGSATFENQAVFDGGAIIDNGSKLIVVDDGTNPVGLGDTVAKGQGDLYFNIYDDDTSHTHTGKITDQINVIKDGSGTLVVDNAANDSTGNFTQNDGTVNLEYGWGGNYIQTDGSLITGDGAVIVGDASFMGDLNPAGENNLGNLTIKGDAIFNDTKYIVSLGKDANNNDASDLVTVEGNAIFGPGSLGAVDIALWDNGTNTILVAGNDLAAAGYDPTTDTTITVNGQVITNDRITAELQISGNDLILVTNLINEGLKWEHGNGIWDYKVDYWVDNANNDIIFAPADYAIFTKVGSGAITVDAGGVQTSGMVVQAESTYTFTGGSIIGSMNASDPSLATGRLDIETGATVAFDNSLEFVNGVNISSGATVTMNDDASFTKSKNVINNGTLIYSKGYDYIIEVAITGSGNIVKEGTGLLTLNGATTSTGTFIHKAGNVMLNTAWNGSYVMTDDSGTTTLYTADSARIMGDALFGAGEISLRSSAPSLLTIDGNMSMSGTTLTVSLYDTGASKLESDSLKVGHNVTFGSQLNKVNVYSWTDGEYLLIAASGTIQNIDGKFDDVMTYNNMGIGDRQTAELVQKSTGIYLFAATSANFDMIWSGNTDGNWDTTTDNNWKDKTTGDPVKYNPNDYVIFDETGKTKDIIVGGAGGDKVEVSGMEIAGGDYTFNGGQIVGKAPADNNGQTITGALEIKDGSGTFNNHIDFENGVIIRDGAAMVISDKGSIAETTGITNEGLFSVNGDTAVAYLKGEGGTVVFTNTTPDKFVTGSLSGSQTFSPIYVNMNNGAVTNVIEVEGNVEGTHMLNLVGTGDINAPVIAPLPTIVIATNNTATGVISSNSFEFGINNYSAQADPGNKSWKLVKSGYSTTAQAIINTAGSISNSWFAQSDNLLKRMGDMRLNKFAQQQGNFWARPYAMGLRGDVDIKGVSKFRENMYGMDFGMDFIAGGGLSGMYTFGGFFGYGHTNRKFRDGYRSDGETESIYAGLYAVYADADGWFIDAIMKGQRFENEFTSRSDKGDYNSYGLGLSVEVGKKMMLDNNFFMEPTLKAEYAHLLMDNYTTSNGLRVRTSDADIFRLSGALRFAGEWQTDSGVIQPYVKVGFEAQTSTGNKVRMAGERFKPNMDGVSAVFGAGVVWQIDDDVQLHADYEGSFGKKYDMLYNVNVGVRVTF